MSTEVCPVFTFSLPGGATRPLASPQLRHWWCHVYCDGSITIMWSLNLFI